MNISPSALKLLNAFQEFLTESSKKEYRFTLEEQRELERMVAVLNKHIDILVDYEAKRNK